MAVPLHAVPSKPTNRTVLTVLCITAYVLRYIYCNYSVDINTTDVLRVCWGLIDEKFFCLLATVLLFGLHFADTGKFLNSNTETEMKQKKNNLFHGRVSNLFLWRVTRAVVAGRIIKISKTQDNNCYSRPTFIHACTYIHACMHVCMYMHVCIYV